MPWYQYLPPPAHDHCRVVSRINSRNFWEDLLVESLPDELLRLETLVGPDPAAVTTLRGTLNGIKFMTCAAHEFAREGSAYEVVMASLWVWIHAPEGPGWDGLTDIGGWVINMEPDTRGIAWRVRTGIPREE